MAPCDCRRRRLNRHAPSVAGLRLEGFWTSFRIPRSEFPILSSIKHLTLNFYNPKLGEVFQITNTGKTQRPARKKPHHFAHKARYFNQNSARTGQILCRVRVTDACRAAVLPPSPGGLEGAGEMVCVASHCERPIGAGVRWLEFAPVAIVLPGTLYQWGARREPQPPNDSEQTSHGSTPTRPDCTLASRPDSGRLELLRVGRLVSCARRAKGVSLRQTLSARSP